MAKLTLITGGCRSGKSREALKLSRQVKGERIFIATCPRIQKIDSEMDERILLHQKERKNMGFQTLEEQLDLEAVFEKLRVSSPPQNYSMIVDCISLWVNNWMYHAEQKQQSITEPEMIHVTRKLIHSARQISGEVFFVTNEVGLGIVPDTKISRLYRDLLGRTNQEIAMIADQVLFMVSGIGMELKKKNNKKENTHAV